MKQRRGAVQNALEKGLEKSSWRTLQGQQKVSKTPPRPPPSCVGCVGTYRGFHTHTSGHHNVLLKLPLGHAAINDPISEMGKQYIQKNPWWLCTAPGQEATPSPDLPSQQPALGKGFCAVSRKVSGMKMPATPSEVALLPHSYICHAACSTCCLLGQNKLIGRAAKKSLLIGR